MDCGANPQPASCCYIGTGVVYACDWQAWQGTDGAAADQPFILPTAGSQSAAPAPFQISSAMRDIGECARLDLDVRTRVERLGRFDGCGGEQCATETLEAIDLTLSMECLSLENLQLAYRGSSTELANAPSGQRITRLAQALRCASRPLAVLFVGINAMDGTSLIVFLPKVKFQVARNRRFITDEFGEITLTGALLHAGNVASGHSPWWDETTIKCLTSSADSDGSYIGGSGGAVGLPGGSPFPPPYPQMNAPAPPPPPPPPPEYLSGLFLYCTLDEVYEFAVTARIDAADPSGTYIVKDGFGLVVNLANPVAGNTNPIVHVSGQQTEFVAQSSELLGIASNPVLYIGQTWQLIHVETNLIVRSTIVPLCNVLP